MSNTIGQLIAFSGIDGAGKTEVIRYVTADLHRKGISVATFLNHQPFSSYWTFLKRFMVLYEERLGIFPYEIDRLFQAVELGVVAEEQLPSLLSQFQLVLSDRFVVDKIVYGRLRGDMGIASVALATVQYIPTLTIFLDVSVETARKRIDRRGGPADWKETPEMLQAAKSSFELELGGYAGKVLRVDAEQALPVVGDLVVAHIEKLLS